jgi:CheY-like chemotaxis protein
MNLPFIEEKEIRNQTSGIGLKLPVSVWSGNPPRVLVVDDDAGVRGLVRNVLRRAGYHIEEAANGLEAIQKTKRDRFDAVVLDLMMPIVSGFDVIRFIEQDRPNVKFVVVMTAAADGVLAAVDSPVVQSKLRKPFEISHLIDAVRACVSEFSPSLS